MSIICWTLGFVVGAVVAGANYWALCATVPKLLQPGRRAPRLSAALGFGARLLVAGLVLGLALRFLPISPITLLLGVSTVPVVLVIHTLMQSALYTTKRI